MYLLFSSDCNKNRTFLDRFLKYIQVPNLVKVYLMGTMRKDGRTDRHDGDNSRFSKFCQRALKQLAWI